MKDIVKLRKQIDSIDEQIVALLNRRTETAVSIGHLKNSKGAEIYVPSREKAVLQRIQSLNKGPLDPAALRAVFREIMSSALAVERQVKVAYFGPAATFTHCAARSRFGTSVDYVARESVHDVFRAVETRECDYGVVPVENSIQGSEAPTLDSFVHTPLKVYAEILYPISHCLLSNSPRQKIRRIYSHPNALGQCQRWLRMEMPAVEQIPASSTSRAAEQAAVERGSAALASALAAELYKLDILEEHIQDIPGNETRFMVLARSCCKPTGDDKTSVIFSVKDRVGSLYRALESFKKFKLNMTKIESRPNRSRAWEYNFFVDFQGHFEDMKVATALRSLSNHCTFLKVVGSYPRAL